MFSSNVVRLRQCHDAFNVGDFDTAVTLVAPDIELTDHGRGEVLNGRAAFRSWMEGFYAMSSDIKIVDAQYIDAGDTVVAQFRAIGVQDGSMDSFPVSNKPYSLDVCEVWRFNELGQAEEGHNYSDSLGMLIQLGHIPVPETA
ncbi:MAG: nuclear transport factor 2 family protein [Anaerolineales bacterium]|nr:nuclear transport factor 2 family protein [Anaerolineales bacterium]